MPQRPFARSSTLLTTAVLFTCIQTSAHANTTDAWNPAITTGNWSTAANWSAGEPGTSTSSVYDLQINATSSSVTVFYDLPSSPTNLNSLTMDGTATSTASLNITAGSALTIQNYEFIGTTGNASIIQTTGTNSTGTLEVGNGASATYILGDTTGDNPTLNGGVGETVAQSGNASFIQYSGNNNAINLFVAYNGTGIYTLNGGNLTLTGGLFLGYHFTNSATFIQNGGNLSVAGNYGYSETIGDNTAGTFIQNAGNHTVTNDLVVGSNNTLTSSFYTMGDLTGDSPTLNIGGNLALGNTSTGTFTQYSGNVNVTGAEYVGNSSTYYDGLLGRFIQYGGNNTVGTLYIGGNSYSVGNYTLAGGNLTITTGPLYLGNVRYVNSSTFLQTGGNIFANGSDPSGISEYIGTNSGNFTQSNGNHTVAHDLVIGSGPTTYTLGNTTGGNPSLTVNGSEHIGTNSLLAFAQYSGTNATANLYLGTAFSQFGNYTLNGGNLTITTGSFYLNYKSVFTQNTGNITATTSPATSEYILSGNFSQNGGNNSAALLYVGYANTFSTANGSYSLGNLNGGNPTLSSGAEYVGYATRFQGPNSGNFTQYSGNNTTGALYVAQTSGSTGNYSLVGGNLTITSGILAVGVGINNTPAFSQSGGNLTVNFADASGVSEYISSSADDNIFNQSGGNNTLVGDLVLASQNNVVAYYYLSGTSANLAVGGNITLGTSTPTFGGVGLFTLSAGSANITGTLTIWSGSTFTLSGGSLSSPGFFNNNLFSQSAGTASFNYINGNGAITISGGLTTAHYLALPTLSLSSTATFQLLPDPTASKLSTLTLAGSTNNWTGSLDLTTSKLIVEATANHTTALANLQNQIAFALANPYGITSSSLQPNQSLVAVDNALAKLSYFGGVPVDASSILLTTALNGDANLDGIVDIKDLQTLVINWQQPTSDWSEADFNHDGIVNIKDLQTLANNWQANLTSATSVSNAAALFPATSSPPPSSVPEPTSLSLLFLSTLPLLHRPKRT